MQVQDPNAAMAADMAAGMYPTLEQQVAAAASGIGPLMSGAAMSPPRSTDVRELSPSADASCSCARLPFPSTDQHVQAFPNCQ